jgi:hypothetical protein
MSDTRTIYVTGTLKSTYNHVDKDDNGNVTKSTNIITVFKDGAKIIENEKDIDINKFFDDFYKGKSAKWIPDWYKNGKDFISIKSGYNIPVKIDNEMQMSFAEWVERGNIRGAEVVIKCNVKESAIYPNAMLVKSEGEPYDAFANF